MAVLWVFKRVQALNNAQGFVDVPDELVPKLLKGGQASETYDQALELEPEPPADAAKPKAKEPAEVVAPVKRDTDGKLGVAPASKAKGKA